MPRKKTQTYSFDTTLEKLGTGSSYTAIFLPEEITEMLPKAKGWLRTKGTVNGVPFELATANRKDGTRFFMVGGILRRQAKIKVGSPLHVEFELVDSNILEIPEALAAALEQDPEASRIFETFTIGYKRSLCYYINSAKSIDSKVNRALQITEKMKLGTLQGQKRQAK